MLNKRQREFRKKMKEAEKIQAAGAAVYSYREQRYSHETPKRRIRRPLLQIGGFFGVVILVWNLYAFSTYITSDGNGFGAFSTKHAAVHKYLQSGGEAEMEISKTVNSLIDHYNSNSLTLFHIEEAQLKLFDLQKTLPLDNNRFASMNHYYDEQFSLAFQLSNVLQLGNAPTVNQELTYLIGKRTELSAGRDSVMVQLLLNEEMNYEILEDGSITYEY